jgi:hypothetical protein
MKRLLFASAVAALALSPLPVNATDSFLDDCFVVRATADARNRAVSTDRAQHRLRRYIADHLSSSGGKSVGPTSTNCIRNACEATAVVCRH